MRVQRAPLAAEQPQQPPAGFKNQRREVPGLRASLPTVEAAPFSAEVALDVTGLYRRLGDDARRKAEIIVELLAACRREGLIAEGSALRIMRPAAGGVLGSFIHSAARPTADGIAAALSSLAPNTPAANPSTLTVVDLSATRVGVTGDWGHGGRGVVTLGAAIPTIMSQHREPSMDLAIRQRLVMRLSFTVQDASADSDGLVRALDGLVHSIESWKP